MARYSVGAEENGNGDRSINRPPPKRHRSPPSSVNKPSTAAAAAKYLRAASDSVYGRISPEEERFLGGEESDTQSSRGSDSSRSDTSSDSFADEEEEEEDRQQEQGQSDGEVQLAEARGDSIASDSDQRSGGAISVTLSDPDALDCPICCDPLCSPVYQCENGHIACASCCTTMKNKCPSCCWPIGYNRCRAIEKVLDSVKIACKNLPRGCKETRSYSKKLTHEKECTYTPCLCPHLDCNYVGISKSLYAHFALKHSRSSKLFHFNDVIFISLDKNQKFAFLQERILNTLFIINRSVETVGSFVNVVCVAPASEKRAFLYDLTATAGESSVKLKVDVVPKWVAQSPGKIYLIVPSYFISSSGQLNLKLTILQNPVYTN